MLVIDLQFLLWLFLISLIFGLWWHAGKAKERALAAARQRCKLLGLQFLDHSVVLSYIRLKRGHRGIPQLQRRYRFEFSSTGDERYRGEVALTGNKVGRIDLDAHRMPDDQGSFLP